MLCYWSEHNKITTKSLQVQYLASFVKTRYGTDIYEWHRIASKSYSYIGMTEAAAKACQAAMLAKYTRNFLQWYNENGTYVGRYSTVCVANVSMNGDEGGLWEVSIDVNEDQMQYSDYYLRGIPYHLFDLGLDYDESPAEGGYLRISNVWRENSRLYLSYEHDIASFDRTSSSFHIEQSTDGGATWTAKAPTSHTDGQMYFNSTAWAAGLIRLRWGDSLISNAEQTPSREYADTLLLAAPYYQTVGTEDSRWRVQFLQDFANFDSSGLTIEARSASADSWVDITSQCDIAGDRVSLPYSSSTAMFQLRATYSGVTATSHNYASFFNVAIALDATVESNQVTTCDMDFTHTLGDTFSASMLSVGYRDSHGGRAFGSDALTITGDGADRTVAFSVGNQILGTSMELSATLKYDGCAVGTATATVHRS